MSKKTCAFQYATNTPLEIIEDTALIILNDGVELLEQYKSRFISDLEEGLEPEMVLWVEMKSDCDYRKKQVHYHYSDCIVKDGEIYKKENEA